MAIRRCNHCQTDHPLTKEYWYSVNTMPQCKVYKTDQRRRKQADPEWQANRLKTLKAYQELNREKVNQWRRDYYARNTEAVIQRNADYAKRRKQTDVSFKLSCYLRSRVNSALKTNKKTGSAIKDLGCTLQELKAHLEAQFTEGMSWDTYGRHGWHVDHILPLSSFDLTDVVQFKKAVHYTNLQPLWCEDNYQKSNKIIGQTS